MKQNGYECNDVRSEPSDKEAAVTEAPQNQQLVKALYGVKTRAKDWLDIVEDALENEISDDEYTACDESGCTSGNGRELSL